MALRTISPGAQYSFGYVVKKQENKLWPLDNSESEMIKLLMFFMQLCDARVLQLKGSLTLSTYETWRLVAEAINGFRPCGPTFQYSQGSVAPVYGVLTDKEQDTKVGLGL